MSATTLQSTYIINTRPKTTDSNLSQQLQQRGATVAPCPLIDIVLNKDLAEIKSHFQDKQHYHAIIVVSQHAARCLQQAKIHNITCPVFAIGPATQKALQALGNDTAIPLEYSSEGLLALDELQNIAGKPILICCGDRSRALLLNTLQQRQAEVDELICYRVHDRAIDVSTLISNSLPYAQTIIIASSQMLLRRLLAVFSTESAWLHQQTLCATHPRIAALAKQSNWRGRIILSTGASDDAISTAVTKAMAHQP